MTDNLEPGNYRARIGGVIGAIRIDSINQETNEVTYQGPYTSRIGDDNPELRKCFISDLEILSKITEEAFEMAVFATRGY